ncbi:hypothetical protein SLEP1_g10738 [Rubroshorea leprosula]|uniref:Uncharacterized protein n=1 Tax=Rubroshorea leprosula TaxID=152421 RepID=A0AAV5IIX2_9ROSI|nr:hypothetical protein SLEP1_g10738 [Rubroshorea leprosula]
MMTGVIAAEAEVISNDRSHVTGAEVKHVTLGYWAGAEVKHVTLGHCGRSRGISNDRSHKGFCSRLMLDLCTSCSSSALRVQLAFDLGSSCLSFALRARPLKLMADLGCKCLNSAAHAKVLHFVLDLCSSALHAQPLQL